MGAIRFITQQRKRSTTTPVNDFYPGAPAALRHVLNLSGAGTNISVDANNVAYNTNKDVLGAAGYRASWGPASPSFFNKDTTDNTLLIDSVTLAKMDTLQIPLTRFYQVWDEPGGVQNGLDRLAAICTRFSIPQEKCIVCIEAAIATAILTPDNYTTAINYAKTKGYTFKYWEISNEPFYYSSTAAALVDPTVYAQHVIDCSNAIKAADPNLKVGCALLRYSTWWTDVVLANAAGHYDWVAPHFYSLVGKANFTTEELILSENYELLTEITYVNNKIKQLNPGQDIPIIDTEWRSHVSVSGYVTGTSHYDGNILGTLHSAVRLIYYLRDGYVKGACNWIWHGIYAGCIIPSGASYATPGYASSDSTGKATYLYALWKNMLKNLGERILNFTGVSPSFTGYSRYPIDQGSGSNIQQTGPLTPVLVTKDSTGDILVIAVANGSTTQTVSFSATISNFVAERVVANQIHDSDIEKNWFQANDLGFYSHPTVGYSNNVVSCDLPPLSVTFIRLIKNESQHFSAAAAPTMTANATSESTILLQWGAIDGDGGYVIQRSPDGATWTDLVTVPSGSIQYIDIGLSAGTPYYYHIKTIGDNITKGTSAYSGAVSATTSAALVALSPDVLYNMTQSGTEYTATAALSKLRYGTKMFRGDGKIVVDISNAANDKIWISLNTSNTDSADYYNMKAGVGVFNGILQAIDNGSNKNSAINATRSTGSLLLLDRTGDTFTAQYSTNNGATWSSVYPIAYKNSADMYVHMIADAIGEKITNPKGSGNIS